MKKNFELFVSSRYLRSARNTGAISFISVVSFLGITIGVMTLIAVLSVMNGFQESIRDKMINSKYHVYVTPYVIDAFLDDYQNLSQRIKKKFPNLFITPFVQSQILIRTSPQRLLAVDMHGVEQDIYQKDTTLKKAIKLQSGKFDLSPGNIIIGNELAKFLGVKTGDDCDIIIPSAKSGSSGGLGMPQLRHCRVSGIFKLGYYEYDLKLVFISLTQAQELIGRPGQAWGLGIKTTDVFGAGDLSYRIKKFLNYKYQVASWEMYEHNFFVALKNEKAIMGFIVFLIIIVAAFNIASSLVMRVVEKKKDIGILMAMGASERQISSVFLLNGILLGAIGTVIGILAGILLATNLEVIFHIIEAVVNFFSGLFYSILHNIFPMNEPMPFRIIAPDVYYFDKLPVSIHWQEIFIIGLGQFVITFLFSFLPARQASKLDPVEAIRYE
jgi:lipoprotein-releasing system permease protein